MLMGNVRTLTLVAYDAMAFQARIYIGKIVELSIVRCGTRMSKYK